MLPSCGHFKNIPCPFFKFALCVRPHCPYKHDNAENLQQRQSFIPFLNETECVFDSKKELNALPHNAVNERPNNASYVPTPVESNSKPPGILKSSSTVETSGPSYLPEYRPTPITQLKECTTVVPVKASKSVYTPEFPVTIRKKKNVEEYDPTEVKCIPKKIVTFCDETDTSSVPVILISSDEDLDDSGDNPKFSDDDFDEENSTSVISSSNYQKQVPDVITIKDEPLEEEKIDEFSVVDKILVDSKKSDMLLSSKKNVSKTDNLSFKTRKNDNNKIVQSIKQEIKENKSDSTIANDEKICDNKLNDNQPFSVFNSIKTEKNVPNDKTNCTVSSKTNKISSKKTEKKISDEKLENSTTLKNLKDEVLDLLHSPPKSKNISLKKDDKSLKKEKTVEKEKKIGGSHSNHSKEKLKKDSKEVDKHTNLKKHSHSQQTDSSGNKSKKMSKLSSNESLDDKGHKKRIENHNIKNKDRPSSPNKKKKLNENENSSKTNQPLIVKLKDKKSSNDHFVKRKSSDFDKHSSKNKSLQKVKKHKSDYDASSPKKQKFEESEAGKSNPLNNDNNMDSDSDSDVNEGVLQDLLSSSESDPDEECRRIFEEFYPENSESAKQSEKEETQQPMQSDSTHFVIPKKKRFAYPAAAEIKPPNKQPKLEMKRPLNPAQVMHNRFLQSQARFAQLNEKKEFGKGIEKKRLCLQPSKNLLDAIKGGKESNPALKNFTPLPPTVSQTYKANQRTAHIPEVAKKPRPIIPAEYGCKVPANIRQKFLNSFIDNCLKICPSEDEAYDMALEEEKKVYDRSSSRPLYLNVAANALQRLRKRAEEGPDVAGNSSASSKANSNQKTVSHAVVLNGPLAQRRSFSIGKKKEAVEIKGKAELYEYLLEYVLTPEQLKENSYPLPHPTEKGRAVIEGAYANKTLYCNDAFKRMCSRCCKTYYVNVDGDYVREEECDFHWGRLWKKRIAGNFESRYSCCQGDAESDGCCVSPGHVFEGSENHVLRGYARTLPPSTPSDNYGIFALDCEMCYTTAGIELTRVTVVDTDLKTVYETFVKPINRVLDYNTRFSGITEDDLKNVKTTLIDVQAVLLCIFNDKSILIGHSLESDFKALKLFHSTVIDTSVVFPHKSGLPFKRALKTLMAEKLNKIIQNDVGGHDSREDAVACMELMLWKVKEDVRWNR